MISVIRYSEEKKDTWDAFNLESKKYLFMFNRNYMDYHKDRFKDHSLMFYNDDKLVAILPMSEKDDMLISHGGLTYGGVISGNDMKQHIMDDVFSVLISYASKAEFKTIIYKSIPYIYDAQVADEDIYALFVNHATLDAVEAATVINLNDPLKMESQRKRHILRAEREGVVVEEFTSNKDFNKFIDMENEVLMTRHNTHAVHTGDELALLHSYFPDNIHLFGAMKEGQMIAGSVVYEYDNVVHTQYLAAGEIAREVGALDLVVNFIIEKYKTSKQWLDFGISTEDGGRYLNQGLVAQKEGFGGRTVAYEIWKLTL